MSEPRGAPPEAHDVPGAAAAPAAPRAAPSESPGAVAAGEARPEVLLVTDVYPPDCGGSGWSAHALARTLVANGHPVEVVGIDPGADGLSQRVFEGVRITELGVRRQRRNPLRRLGARDYAHAAVQRYLERRLGDAGGRVVHAQHLHSGPPSMAAARRCGDAAVLTLRDYWPVCLHGTSWWNGAECPGCSAANLSGCMNEYWGWPRLLARAMVPWARRRLAARRDGIAAADRNIAVSEWVRGRIGREAAGCWAVLPNIVDSAAAGAAADAAPAVELPFAGPYLCAAGKLHAAKGFDLMLGALAEAGCRWPLVIAGAGPERRRLERQAAVLDLQVFFTGWVAHPTLLRLIRSSHAFLLPAAWSEPLSRLLLEALALGAPVIAWKRGGNPEHLTNGADAWLVGDADDLRRALRELEDGALRQRVAAAGRELAARAFAPDAVYPRLRAIYEEAMAARGASSGVTDYSSRHRGRREDEVGPDDRRGRGSAA